MSTSASVGVEPGGVSLVLVACGLAPGFSLGLCEHLEPCRISPVLTVCDVCVCVCVCVCTP